MSPVRKQNPENGSSVVKIGAVVLVLCLGLWGCARKPAARVGSGDNKVLDSKVQKLENDLRTASQARDKARKDITVLEGDNARLQQEATEKAALLVEKANLLEKIKSSQAERDEMHKLLVARTNERDDLRQQIGQRIQERDSLANRVDKLRKGLQQMLTQDDNPNAPVPGTPGSPTTPATPVSNPGPSLSGQS